MTWTTEERKAYDDKANEPYGLCQLAADVAWRLVGESALFLLRPAVRWLDRVAGPWMGRAHDERKAPYGP